MGKIFDTTPVPQWITTVVCIGAKQVFKNLLTFQFTQIFGCKYIYADCVQKFLDATYIYAKYVQKIVGCKIYLCEIYVQKILLVSIFTQTMFN